MKISCFTIDSLSHYKENYIFAMVTFIYATKENYSQRNILNKKICQHFFVANSILRLQKISHFYG